MGVVLYILLVGDYPFTGATINELYNAILASKALTFPPHISGPAKDLLCALLCRTPSQRLSMEDLERHPWLREHSVSPPSLVETLCHATSAVHPQSAGPLGRAMLRGPHDRMLKSTPIILGVM